MKKRTKGILAFMFLGGIMVTSGVVIAIPGITPEETPADKFSLDDRPKYCGSNDPKSTDFIQEFSIPTECTNPLAISVDYDGNVWFAETGTGNLAKFEPTTEMFTEYENDLWPKGVISMMWGLDYAPDGSVWFTDDSHDSLWRFSVSDERYSRLPYSSAENSTPQRLQVAGSNIIVNDLLGNQITFLDLTLIDADTNYVGIPSPIDDSLTASFAVDADGNLWYTNWLPQQGGILVKFDHPEYVANAASTGENFLPLIDYVELFELPSELLTPNGIAIDSNRTVWLADTSSSFFFSFDPDSETFVRYVTAEPVPSTYGNQTGIVKTPISRPYWMESGDGKIVFNSHTSNNISVMDPITESLTEYHVPSKNPYWADCDPGTGIMLADCGVAQVFDIAIDGKKIWFTEWVENNIGVVDTDVSLPVSIQLESDSISLQPGSSAHFNFIVSPNVQQDLAKVQPLLVTTSDFLDVEFDRDSHNAFDPTAGPTAVHTNILASEDAPAGTYKILVGAQLPDVAISKFITVTIE